MKHTEAAQTDREDLLALLEIRFGRIPPEIRKQIEDIEQPDTLERLILVGANVPSWEVFVAELQEKDTAFRIVGERFNPIEAND